MKGLIGGHIESSETAFDTYKHTSLNTFYIRLHHTLRYLNEPDINLKVKP